jgi:AcrR family transcriptional regulator
VSEQESANQGEQEGLRSDGALSDAQVLDAALDAFAEEGFAGTSVRSLARRMGVNHNHIPQRFGSKERLWYAAVDHGFRVIRRDLYSMLEASFPDELSQLRAVIVRYVEISAARPALLRIINQEAVLGGPRLEYLFSAYIDPVYRFGSGLLAKLEAQGAVRTDSAGLLYFFMTNGVAGPIVFPGLASRLGVGLDQADPAAVHELAVAAVDLLFDGLTTHD